MNFANNKPVQLLHYSQFQFQSTTNHTISDRIDKMSQYSNNYSLNSQGNVNSISSTNQMKRSGVYNIFPEKASYKLPRNLDQFDNNILSGIHHNNKNTQNIKTFQLNREYEKSKTPTSMTFAKDFKLSLDTNALGSRSAKNIDDPLNSKINMYSSHIVSSSSTKPALKMGLQSFGRNISQAQQINGDNFTKNKGFVNHEEIQKPNPIKSNSEISADILNRFPLFQVQKGKSGNEKMPINNIGQNKRLLRTNTYSYDKTNSNQSGQYQKPIIDLMKYDKVNQLQASNKLPNNPEYKTNDIKQIKLNQFKLQDFKSAQYKSQQFKPYQNQKYPFATDSAKTENTYNLSNPFRKDKTLYQNNANNVQTNFVTQTNNFDRKQYYIQLSKKTAERISNQTKRINQGSNQSNNPSSAYKKPSFLLGNISNAKIQQNSNISETQYNQNPNPNVMSFTKMNKKLSFPLPNTFGNQQKGTNNLNNNKLELKKLCKDDFAIGKKLGKGKFGDVFLVKNKTVGFVCAMKIIPKKIIRDQKLQNQFSRQVTIQFYLQHQNITALYGYFDDNDFVYLLLQLCLNGQLFQVLKERRRLPEQQASGILKQVCIGTQYMHRQRIIHRDLKPENIILQGGIAKICDFGWAVYSADGLRQTFCGTPLYVSPQILKGEKYDEKIDIWAIGILSYELLIGRIPFKINSENDLKRIINDQIKFPEYIPISDTAKDFIMKILKKNPQDRLEIEELLSHEFLKKQVQCTQLIDANFLN